MTAECCESFAGTDMRGETIPKKSGKLYATVLNNLPSATFKTVVLSARSSDVCCRHVSAPVKSIVPHRRILPSYQAERWSVSSPLCWWCCYCLVDQLWVLIAYAWRSNLLLLTVCAVQVFFSSYVFSTNVMVKVATRPAVNPVGQRFVTIIIIII